MLGVEFMFILEDLNQQNYYRPLSKDLHDIHGDSSILKSCSVQI
jgi:hypothetical protein